MFNTIVHEFNTQVFGSSFGKELRLHAFSITNKPEFAAEKCFADPEKNLSSFLHHHFWSDARDVTTLFCNSWVDLNYKALSVLQPLSRALIAFESGDRSFVADFDEMWRQADQFLWKSAKSLDRPDEPGGVAKRLGLVDPDDPERPTYTNDILKLLDTLRARRQARSIAVTPATPRPSVGLIPVATSTDSSVRSGHAFLAESKDSKPKKKAKTHGIATVDEPAVTEEVTDENDDDEENQCFPEVLPLHFKLGKRLMKVFTPIR